MKGAGTVNVACAASPVEPVTVTVYVPGGTPPTKNVPLGAPLPGTTKVQVGAEMSRPPVIVQVVSAAENPTPVTVTCVPGGPLFGVRVIEGLDTTVKLAEAASPDDPVTVIV